jgi:opacity protein-like surface antigen
MKKVLVSALLAVSALGASALELGVVGTGEFVKGSHHPVDGMGLTLGQHFGAFSATVEADRESTTNVNKFALVGGYDVATVAGVTVTAKAGVAYLDNQTLVHSNRYAGVVGAGVSYPVAKSVALTADYRYQADRNTVHQLDGSTVAVGARYSF